MAPRMVRVRSRNAARAALPFRALLLRLRHRRQHRICPRFQVACQLLTQLTVRGCAFSAELAHLPHTCRACFTYTAAHTLHTCLHHAAMRAPSHLRHSSPPLPRIFCTHHHALSATMTTALPPLPASCHAAAYSPTCHTQLPHHLPLLPATRVPLPHCLCHTFHSLHVILGKIPLRACSCMPVSAAAIVTVCALRALLVTTTPISHTTHPTPARTPHHHTTTPQHTHGFPTQWRALPPHYGYTPSRLPATTYHLHPTFTHYPTHTTHHAGVAGQQRWWTGGWTCSG